MAIRKRKAVPEDQLLPDEKPDIGAEVARYFDDPEIWLESPNVYLAGRSPNEAIRKGDELAVREVLRRLRYIGVS